MGGGPPAEGLGAGVMYKTKLSKRPSEFHQSEPLDRLKSHKMLFAEYRMQRQWPASEY
jgi:hypothetical protein